MPTIPLYQVDAFTAEPFRGNPAAVCLLDAPLPDRVMQAIAAEMNLSETAFVQPLGGAPWRDADRFSLRWFTPMTEVRLCGHATLATAHVLFSELESRGPLSFETLGGVLGARQADGMVWLDFPADPPVPCPLPAGLAQALGNPDIAAVAQAPQTGMLLAHFVDRDALLALEPNYPVLREASVAAGAMGVIVTTAGAPPYDFVSRFFAPAVGINEDPVTGSAHTVLGPYWRRLLGRDYFLAYQASARGGVISVAVLPGERVALGGQAVVVFSGSLRLP